MKRMIMMLALAAFLVAALSVSALSAFAAPQDTPPGLTTKKVNGGGNTPNGNANGVPEQTCNQGGKCPPGQN
jgi:Spy/CpxP family protein refolding chaperone